MSQLLVFVDIFVEQPEMDRVVAALSKLENVVDLYEVTGEFDVVTLIAVDNLEEFRKVLHDRIMKVKGVRSTVSSIVLKVQKGSRTKAAARLAGGGRGRELEVGCRPCEKRRRAVRPARPRQPPGRCSLRRRSRRQR